MNWLCQHRRGALWYEVGVGKTITAIRAANRPVLIACPAYLCGMWRDEILSLYPDEQVIICEGTSTARLATLNNNPDAEWTIINIEMLRSYTFVRRYETFIIDEAHHLRGHSSQQSKGALAVAQATPNVYQLTATPIKCEPDDLFMQLQILDPKKFTSYNAFVQQYCKVINVGFGTKVRGLKDGMTVHLSKLLNNYRVRRTYKSTGLKRPTPIERTIEVTPSSNWLKLYKKVKKDYRLLTITFESAPAMVMQLCAMTFDLKIDIAKQIYEDNPKTVFYCYFRESAYQLAKSLNIPAITGDLKPNDRAALAKGSTAIVATISSLSEGVDLSHFNTVAFLEESYLPDDKTQAVGRVSRWSPTGTSTVVNVFTVLVKSTIDSTKHGVVGHRAADIATLMRTELERE